MTDKQVESLDKVIGTLAKRFSTIGIFHHGGGAGSEERAALLARVKGLKVTAHPTTNVNHRSRRLSLTSHIIMPPVDNALKNRNIVNISDLMIAAPYEEREVMRAGTWSTVRYTRLLAKPIIIIYPMGLVESRQPVSVGDDMTIQFVCNECADRKHENCKGSTWCDCQHRFSS